MSTLYTYAVHISFDACIKKSESHIPTLYSWYNYLSFHHTAPSGAPDMFEAVAQQREVVFSWSPPPVTPRSRPIISYTLSCSPSPSSLPLSPSQSGPLTVAGFSPDTSYSCSVVVNNDLESGSPAYTNFTTLEDCEYWRKFVRSSVFILFIFL